MEYLKKYPTWKWKKLLSKLLKTNIVYQFRKNDLFAGGEGAPISPIYHKLIIETLKLSLPAIVFKYWDH